MYLVGGFATNKESFACHRQLTPLIAVRKNHNDVTIVGAAFQLDKARPERRIHMGAQIVRQAVVHKQYKIVAARQPKPIVT